MNYAIQFLSPFIISYINKIFASGLKLPIRHAFTQCVSRPEIRLYEGYVLIEAEPDFINCDFRALDADVEQRQESKVVRGEQDAGRGL